MRVWTPGLVARLQAFLQRGGRVALIGSPLDRRGQRTGTAIDVAEGTQRATLRGATRGTRQRGAGRPPRQASPGNARSVSTTPSSVMTAALATGRPRIARPLEGTRANTRRA